MSQNVPPRPGLARLWLMARFHIYNELDQIDFTDNNSWFNIKLMISTHNKYVKSGKLFENSTVTRLIMLIKISFIYLIQMNK